MPGGWSRLLLRARYGHESTVSTVQRSRGAGANGQKKDREKRAVPKMELSAGAARKIGRSCRVGPVAETCPDTRKSDQLASAAAVLSAVQIAAGLSRRSRAKKAPATGPEVFGSLPETQECGPTWTRRPNQRMQLCRGRSTQHRNRRPNLASVRAPGNLRAALLAR